MSSSVYLNDPEFQSVIDIHKEVDNGLREIESRGMPSDIESKENLTHLIGEVLNKIVQFKETFHAVSNVQLSQRKMSLLDSDDESLDISIQFFGLEWKLVLRRWERVGKSVQIMFNTWIQQNKKVKVDMLLFGEIIKSINQTSAEIESHRAAIMCGQLTEDQKQCQLKIRNLSIHKSQEIVSTNLEAVESNGRGICFSEKIRRKSVKLNESIGKHLNLKCSLRRRNSQIIRNKSPIIDRRKGSMQEERSHYFYFLDTA